MWTSYNIAIINIDFKAPTSIFSPSLKTQKRDICTLWSIKSKAVYPWHNGMPIQRSPIDVQVHSGHLCRYVPGPTSCVATSPHMWRLRLSNCDSLNEFGPFTALIHLRSFLFWGQLTEEWWHADRWLGSTSQIIIIPKKERNEGHGLHNPGTNFEHSRVIVLLRKPFFFAYLWEKDYEMNSKTCIHWMQVEKGKEGSNRLHVSVHRLPH